MIISPNSTKESHDSSCMSCDLLGLGTLQLEDPLRYAWWIFSHVTTIYWYNVQGEMSSLDEVRGERQTREREMEQGRESEVFVLLLQLYTYTCMHFTESVSRKLECGS